MDEIESMVREYSRRSADVVEAACERMLVTPGDFGVAVHSWIEGNGAYTQAVLTHDVAPMTIEYRDGKPEGADRD